VLLHLFPGKTDHGVAMYIVIVNRRRGEVHAEHLDILASVRWTCILLLCSR